MNKTVIILICLFVLTACSSAPQKTQKDSSLHVASKHVDLSDSQKVKRILNQQYQDWRYVPHRMGGTTRKGIDCSGLVYRTYLNEFGVYLPRTAEDQSRIGRPVPQSRLRAGDLVFFKTGVFTRHVGMYIDRGDFLHVSSSKGVMISSLEDSYWTSKCWKARRVQ